MTKYYSSWSHPTVTKVKLGHCIGRFQVPSTALFIGLLSMRVCSYWLQDGFYKDTHIRQSISYLQCSKALSGQQYCKEIMDPMQDLLMRIYWCSVN